MANNATANFSHISILLYTKNQPESTPNLIFFVKFCGVSPLTSLFDHKTKILGKAEDFAILMININIFYPSW
jgi:hypothetical protein